MHQRHRKQSAFTLLELILAMMVTCMLAATLYESLRVGLRARDSAEAAVDPARAAQVAMELIGKDLESALPPQTSTSVTSLIGAFEGTDGGTDGSGDTLEYFALNSGVENDDPTVDDGLKKIDLDVEPLADGTPALVRRVTHNLLAQIVPDPDIQILCRNVSNFNLRYLSNDTWSDFWDSTAQSDALPAAVEVSMDITLPGAKAQTKYHVVRLFSLAGATQ